MQRVQEERTHGFIGYVTKLHLVWLLSAHIDAKTASRLDDQKHAAIAIVTGSSPAEQVDGSMDG